MNTQGSRQGQAARTSSTSNLSPKRLRWWHYLLVGCVIMVLVWGWLLLQNPLLFPIKRVNVEASYAHLQPKLLARTIAPDVRGDFFGLNLTRLQTRILKLAWVREVVIRRQWPDTLVIKITERHAIARWGQQALLDDQGQIFTPMRSTFPPDLPDLFGPDIDAVVVLNQYQKLKAQLAPLKLNITALTLSPRHAWHLTLSNGIQLALGSRHIDQRIDDFVVVYPKLLANKANKITLIDLRYPNGLAIAYK